MATAGGLVASEGQAGKPKPKPVRVGLVFLSKTGSSWPHPKFDVEAREREILGVLRKGCPAAHEAGRVVSARTKANRAYPVWATNMLSPPRLFV